MTEIILEKGIESIGSQAFSACGKLTSVTLPESVTYISERSFESCDRLESIRIPASVIRICDYAFEDCEKLTSIYFDGTQAQWVAIGKDSLWDIRMSDYVVYCQDGNFRS